MNLNEKTKKELCNCKYTQSCCKIAALSAFVRTSGSIIAENNNYGFSVTGFASCVEYYGNIVEELFNCTPIYNVGKSCISGFTVLNEKSFSILVELGIIQIENGEISVVILPDDYITENECCKKAYIRGSFMGGGYLTVPDINAKNCTTGYHLEFVFSKYLTAQHFAELMCEVGFMPKLIERKNSFVVYFKQHEEIKDILAYMGASNAVLELADLVVLRDVKNNINRACNCEISNVNKQVEASMKQCSAIKSISETIGLENLSKELENTARARLKYSDFPLSDLAEILGITKSCLNHRLRKLVAIAETLK